MRATRRDHARPWRNRRVRYTMVPVYPATATTTTICTATRPRRVIRIAFRRRRDATTRARRAMPRVTNGRSPGVRSVPRGMLRPGIGIYASRSPRDREAPPPPCRPPRRSSPSTASWRRGRSATSSRPRAPPPSRRPRSRRRTRSNLPPVVPRRSIRYSSSCITWRSPLRIFSVGSNGARAPRRLPPGVTPFGRTCRESLKEAAKTLKRPSNPLDFF